MVDFAAAVVTTILFTILFSFFIVQLNIDEIKGDWANRRCELAVMVVAGACKPDSDPRSGLEFGIENFKFCSGIIAKQVLKQAFAPMFSVVKQGFESIKKMAGPMNVLRYLIKSAREVFESFLDTLYKRFSVASWLLQRTNLHFQYAFGRIQGIFYSILYLGLTLVTLISNQLDFTVQALKVFLGIIAGLFPILIIPLAPFIKMINDSMDALENANYGGGMDSARSAFCVDPGAQVYMADGSIKALKTIRIGDILKSSDPNINRVTGILTVSATTIPIVSIHGIQMSGSHRVLLNGNWILARDHPQAIPVAQPLDTLICLNTTQHSVPIATSDGNVLHVGDWEEVSTEEGRKAWINIVSDILKAERSPTHYPKSVPLLGSGVQVYIQGDRLPIPISEVRLGDHIRSEKGEWTRVVGIYKGTLSLLWAPSNPDWMSDGIWMKNVRGAWALRSNGEKHSDEIHDTVEGYHLVTEAEIFQVLHQGHRVLVRDFTELGASRIEDSYEMLDYYINKK